MTLIAKASNRRDLGDRQIAMHEQLLGILQATPLQVAHGTFRDASAESPAEVEAADPSGLREIGQRYALAKVRFDVFMYQPQRPAAQPVRGVSWRLQVQDALGHDCSNSRWRVDRSRAGRSVMGRRSENEGCEWPILPRS
jgi:hypothetical protein